MLCIQVRLRKRCWCKEEERERRRLRTGSSLVVRTASAVGLLHGEASTEGTGDGSVAAADGADVARGGANAVEVIGHLDVDGEALGLGLAQTVLAGHIVGNLELDKARRRIGRDVEIALVGAGTISVDLVDGNSQAGALGNSRDGLSGDGLLGLAANVDVAVDLGAAARVHDVLLDLAVADDGGVLLAGGDTRAVAGEGVIDLEALALARVADGGLDDTVGVDGGKEGGERQDGGLVTHVE